MTIRNLNQGVFPAAEFMERELQGIVIGNRIPQDFFEAKGIGESDIAIHAGSYHQALRAANIEMFNIMTFSSILPGIARKVEKPHHTEHGAVLESILSVCNTRKGERATAGIIYGWLYDKKTKDKFGGLVCEHYGDYSIDGIKELLLASLDELYINSFSEDYSLYDITYLTESFVPKKEYGTAIVGLCFTSYYYPILQNN